MAIGRITGPMLYSNLERQGADLAIDGNVVYFDVTNRRLGVGTSTPGFSIDSPGNVKLANIIIRDSTITSNTGVVDFGAITNLRVTGGLPNYIVYTDGNGNLNFANLNTLSGLESFSGNNIVLGSNTAPSLVSNAVALTTSTSVTDAISELNYVLGKLVPPAPPVFPGSSTLSLSTGVSAGRMANFVQTDNSGWGNLSVAAGTSTSATRVSTYAAGTITNVGPGDLGTVTAYYNGVAAGTVTLAAGSQNGTYGNLVITNDQDYHNVVSSVTAGFWESFTSALSGTGVQPGWNRASISDTAGSPTNTITWYYDSSTPGTPTFSNTSIALTTNSSSYSSTIPHFNSSTNFRIKGNVARLSGDTYPVAVTSGTSVLVSTSAGGPFSTPAAVTYTGAGVTVPLDRNLYVSSGSAYFEMNVGTTTGFGSSAGGPALSVNNNYATGSSGAIIVSGTPTVLYKTGTASSMEETSLTFGSTVGTGAGQAFRIITTNGSDTPTYTSSEAAFNSQTSTLLVTDATIVASVLKHDQTNYSTGYLPVGPDLSTGRSGAQYFTFKFVRTSVSKFDIKFSGTIAGLWVALPGSGIDTSSTLNGWVTMDTAYAGAGQPGAGTGGNGSNGCALGGTVTLNSLVANHRKTCTFGTVSSSGTATNEIYVRIKLTAGQTVTALSLETASN